MIFSVSLCLTVLIAYLVGAIPFGYLVARWRGVDIFRQGSGNIGATNVGRLLGKRFGVLVFLLDFSKGVVGVLLGQWLANLPGPLPGDCLPANLMPVAGGFMAIVGHLFPVYLRFKGGKGVATGAGVVTILLPVPLLVALLVWIGVLIAWSYVSLASICAALVLAGFRLLVISSPFSFENVILTSFCLLASLLVIARHRSNLLRLLQGHENRIKETPAMALFTKLVHVLALGLWFGSTVFFTFVVGLSLFHTFDEEGSKEHRDRPSWFPMSPDYDHDLATRKEQGTRAFGAAIGPMFKPYFLIQAVCAALALASAWRWCGVSPGGRVHKARIWLIGLAAVGVAAGAWIEGKVADLNVQRNAAVDKELQSTSWPPPESIKAEADAARSTFGKWHGISMSVNLATMILVALAMSLTAVLPTTLSNHLTEPIPMDPSNGPAS